MLLDPITFIVTTIITAAIGITLLYFVIKTAVKNALHEDRVHQAAVERVRREG